MYGGVEPQTPTYSLKRKKKEWTRPLKKKNGLYYFGKTLIVLQKHNVLRSPNLLREPPF